MKYLAYIAGLFLLVWSVAWALDPTEPVCKSDTRPGRIECTKTHVTVNAEPAQATGPRIEKLNDAQ